MDMKNLAAGTLVNLGELETGSTEASTTGSKVDDGAGRARSEEGPEVQHELTDRRPLPAWPSARAHR